MENKNERVESILNDWREWSKQRKDAIENDDWELYKKAWRDYNNDYDEDFVRLMFDTEKLKHKGATPIEVFTAQLTGLFNMAVKHNIDLSTVFKVLNETINKRLSNVE